MVDPGNQTDVRPAAPRHTLVVSYEEQTEDERAEGVDPRLDDYLQVDIECSNPSGMCLTWWECTKPHVVLEKGWTVVDEIYEGNDLWHGVEHQVIDGMAMTASNPPMCLAHAFPTGQDNAFELASGMEPGRYPVEITYEGDEYVHVELLPPAEATA